MQLPRLWFWPTANRWRVGVSDWIMRRAHPNEVSFNDPAFVPVASRMANAIAMDAADRQGRVMFVPTRDLVSHSTESGSSYASALTSGADAESIRDGLRGKFVCPFCGSVNDSEQGMCPRCTMENSAATRKATKTRIGPWYVLQTRNPAAPGMTWETLLSFVRKGRVKPRSILRGPTTHQLWRFAAQVKGLSREFGICYSCGSGIETSAALCPTCNRLQDPPPNPDALLEASRDAQSPNYTTPPATIDGSVLAAAGPATVVGQVSPGSMAATPPSAIGPAVNEGDFVIPALGSGGAGATTAAASVAATPTAPQTHYGPTPASAGPATRQSTVPPPAAKATPPVSGISGDASWARIPATPRERPAARSTPRGAPANNAAPAGPAFNPYADDDAPGRRNDAEGFLSAKDLAAAFNLGFVGEEDEAPVQRTVRQPANSAAPRNPMHAPAAAATTFQPPQQRKSRFGVLKGILLMLLLAGAGYGVAVALSPELLEKSKAWIQEKMDALSQQTEADKLGDQPRKPPTAPKPTPTKPTTLPSDTDRTAGSADDHKATQPATQPTNSIPTVPPTAPSGGNSWVGSPAQKLYAEALDLEETDPKSALSKYKQIKQNFASDLWPTDLEGRIQRLEAANNKPGSDPGL